MTTCPYCKTNTISLKRMVDYDVCSVCGCDKPDNEVKNGKRTMQGSK